MLKKALTITLFLCLFHPTNQSMFEYLQTEIHHVSNLVTGVGDWWFGLPPIIYKHDCGCTIDHIKSSNSFNYKENVTRFAYGELLNMKLDYMFIRRERMINRMIVKMNDKSSGIVQITHRRVRTAIDMSGRGIICIVPKKGGKKAASGKNLFSDKMKIKIFPEENPNYFFEQEPFVETVVEFKNNFLKEMKAIQAAGNENTVLDSYQLSKLLSLLLYSKEHKIYKLVGFTKWESSNIAVRFAKEALAAFLTLYIDVDEETLRKNTEYMCNLERANIIYFINVFKGVIYGIQKDISVGKKYIAKKAKNPSFYKNPLPMSPAESGEWEKAMKAGRAKDYALNKLLDEIANEIGGFEGCSLDFYPLVYEVKIEKETSTQYFYIAFFVLPLADLAFDIHMWQSAGTPVDEPMEKAGPVEGLVYRKTNISFNTGSNNIKDEFEHACRATALAWKTALGAYGLTEKMLCGDSEIYHPDQLSWWVDIPEPVEQKNYFDFYCMEFKSFLGKLVGDDSREYSELLEELAAFSGRNEHGEKVELGKLTNMMEHFELLCTDEPSPDSGSETWSGKRGVPLLEKPEKNKTIGIIRYDNRIVLIIRFWMRIKPTGEDLDENEEDNPTPHNAKMCFEIESFLTENIKSYYECFNYPDIKVPNTLNFEFYYLLYQPVLRVYYRVLKQISLMAPYYIVPENIYEYLFLYFEAGNDKNLLFPNYKIIYEYEMLTSIDGIYKAFRLESHPLVFFTLKIYRMNTYYYRIILRQGFREFEFYVLRYFENNKENDERSKADIKKEFLENNYLIYVKNFFESILYTENQADMSNIVKQCFSFSGMNLNNFEDSGMMMYFSTDLISFPIIAVSFENLMLDNGFEKIDLERSKFEAEDGKVIPDLDKEIIFGNGIEYFFYTTKEMKTESDSFSSFKWDDLVIDKIIADKKSILESTLQITQNDYISERKNTFTFIFGMPIVNRKIQVILFAFEEGYSPMLLLKFSCQFFVHEFLIPYSSLYELLPTINNIVTEIKKNLMSYVLYFNDGEPSEKGEDLTSSEIITIIKEINSRIEHPLPLCIHSILEEKDQDFSELLGKTSAKFYILKNQLYESYFTDKAPSEIENCEKIDKLTNKKLAIEISFAAPQNKPGYSIKIFEPYKNRGKNTLLNDTISVKEFVKDKTMISDYQVLKSFPKKHKDIVEKYLKSALGHYLQDVFDPIDQEMIEKLGEALGKVEKAVGEASKDEV